MTGIISGRNVTLEDILAVTVTHTYMIQQYSSYILFFPQKMKTYVHMKDNARMFIVAWFILTKTGNKSNVLQIGMDLKKLFCIHTMEYY